MRKIGPEQFVSKTEEALCQEAQERWGVDLNDNLAVLEKLQSFGGNMPDVADLSNLQRDFKALKDAVEDSVEQAA